jgi:2-keto-4-pentenoate hydratase/2-oxohepta-3-ene-1,7-dioic acid hydratase in catechol pathway
VVAGERYVLPLFRVGALVRVVYDGPGGMRLVLFEAAGYGPRPGVLTDRGVVAVADVVGSADSPQATMVRLIDGFAGFRARLGELASNAEAVGLDSVTLLPPLPTPGKILCSTAVYGRPKDSEPAPLLMTLKSAESVVGPGATIVLPDVGDEWQFAPEAELGLVIRGPARNVKAADWRSAVFGFTCVFDVMARGDQLLGRDFWLAKADTLGPLGPYIVTADEVADPNALRVRSRLNNQSYQDYSTANADYGVAYQVEFATTVMTLSTGDVLACGSASTSDLGALADGDDLEMEIEPIGRLKLGVRSMAGTPR